MFPAWEHTRGGLEDGKNLGQLKNQKMASVFTWMLINVHVHLGRNLHTHERVHQTHIDRVQVHTSSEAHIPVRTTTPTHAPS